MNFNDLQERCWTFLGYHDSGSRQDWRRQQIRDALNNALDEMGTAAPFLWNLVRESSIAVVAGTAVYTLDDWVERGLFWWTEGSAAHPVAFRNYKDTTRDGSRNSAAAEGSLGPYELTWYPRTSTANKSGLAGSCVEGTTAFTGGAGFVAADVGRRLRLNGEDMDHKIAAYVSATALTLDRAVKSRLTGLATAGTGAGYTSIKWELSPAGAMQIKFLPTPQVASTVYYSYLAKPRRLMLNDDTPEIPEKHQHLLWKGAIAALGAFNEDDATHQRYKMEYEQAVATFKAEDQDDMASNDAAHYESSLDQSWNSKLPNDVYNRGQ